MFSAGGSFRIDPRLTFSSSCFASFNYPPVSGLFSCNATHLSYTNHQRNCFRLGRQSMVKAHRGFLLDSFTPHVKKFNRLLGAVVENNLKPWTSRVGELVDKSSSDRLLQVVLYSPQIPGNTGCIARTCAASAVGLHLVEDIAYKPGDWLIFGSETSGLSTEALNDCTNEIYGGGTVRIPMLETYVRCLNLSVSVGIAIYEASRQLKYEQFGDLSSMFIESESMTE